MKKMKWKIRNGKEVSTIGSVKVEIYPTFIQNPSGPFTLSVDGMTYGSEWETVAAAKDYAQKMQ